MFRRVIGLLMPCIIIILTLSGGTFAYSEEMPVRTDASPEARKLLEDLYKMSGNGIISGQFNYIEEPDYWTEEVHRITDKYPALWGGDFSYYFGIDLDNARSNLVKTAKEQWHKGSIISLCFHQQKPSDPYDAGWGSVQGWYSEEEMNQLVTPGTELYNQWLEDIDDIAEYLKELRDAGIPVLWRPYHEMNGGWFWWGGRPDQFIQLWRNMYDRYMNYHGLNNLIWVWCPNANDPQWTEDFSLFYPGDEFVDVLAQDIYNNSYYDIYYQQLLDLADGKPIAIGECGELPDIDKIRYTQPNYVYFMAWGKMLVENNSIDTIRNVYSNPYVKTRDKKAHPNKKTDPSGNKINVALDKTVVASSSRNSGLGPEKAVDGKTSTQWLSGTGDSEWIYVDLGTNYNIQGAKLIWEAGYSREYAIQVSNDAVNWIEIYNVKSDGEGIDYIDELSSIGRYVRIFGKQQEYEKGYCLYELEVYGDEMGDIGESLITNFEFDNGTEGWYWLQSGNANGSMSIVEGAGLSGTNALKVNLDNGGEYSWNAQVNHVLPIESGKTYNISFMAKADEARPMEIIIQQNSGSYTAYWYKAVEVTNTVSVFGPYSFTCSVTDPEAVLRFNLGGNNTPVYIDRVLITENN